MLYKFFRVNTAIAKVPVFKRDDSFLIRGNFPREKMGVEPFESPSEL